MAKFIIVSLVVLLFCQIVLTEEGIGKLEDPAERNFFIIDGFQTKLHTLENKVSHVPTNLDIVFAKLTKQYTDCTEHINNFKQEIATLKGNLMSNSGSCNTCKTDVLNSDQIKQIRDDILNINNEMINVKVLTESLETQLVSISTQNTELNNKFGECNIQLNNIKNDIVSVQQQTTTQIAHINQSMTTINERSLGAHHNTEYEETFNTKLEQLKTKLTKLQEYATRNIHQLIGIIKINEIQFDEQSDSVLDSPLTRKESEATAATAPTEAIAPRHILYTLPSSSNKNIDNKLRPPFEFPHYGYPLPSRRYTVVYPHKDGPINYHYPSKIF